MNITGIHIESNDRFMPAVFGNDVDMYKSVKANAKIDWTLKESIRARLRRDVKRILNRYGYPPDMQQLATDNVLKQAELLADELNGCLSSI